MSHTDSRLGRGLNLSNVRSDARGSETVNASIRAVTYVNYMWLTSLECEFSRLTKSFSNKGSYAIRSVLTRHPPCAVVWPAVQVIFLIPETMVGFDFFSDVSFFSYASISWIWRHRRLYPPRLSVLWTYALFWRMESYYIIVMDILWINLHPNTSPTDLSGPGYWHYWPDCVLPYILTTWHAWPMT